MILKHKDPKTQRHEEFTASLWPRALVSLCSKMYLLYIIIGSYSCNQPQSMIQSELIGCVMGPADRFTNLPTSVDIRQEKNDVEGMVLVPAGIFMMGATDDEGKADEYPAREVKVKSFYIDITEVTNAQFAEFVNATGYITTAEQTLDWEELKKQLPEGTAKPHDSLLQAASLVFTPTRGPVDLKDPGQWWTWTKGASWKHPQGPGSTIKGKEDHPVVHVSMYDAIAYCKWAGKRLPTQAEWEWAARGELFNKKYPWGDDFNEFEPKANTWQGSFPDKNLMTDKYFTSAPVKSFPANGFNLFDMAGNVWEWTSDSYLRGGSFLCNPSYCKGYRVSAKSATSPDSGFEHVGFRCVK